MEVTWSKPPSNEINGKLLGYRVYYHSTKNPDQVFNRTVTRPDERNITLTGLHKFTSYRVRVVAFTRVGEGVPSLPRGGKTLEDSECECVVGFCPAGSVKQFDYKRKISIV